MHRAAQPADLARLFAALADPTRLRLLNLMVSREVCVCYFVEILGQAQPKISRHLAYLRRAGIVSARREGKWMHYRIRWPQDHSAVFILRAVLASLAESPEMQADLARLENACCAAPESAAPGSAASRSAALVSAPSPISFI